MRIDKGTVVRIKGKDKKLLVLELATDYRGHSTRVIYKDLLTDRVWSAPLGKFKTRVEIDE